MKQLKKKLMTVVLALFLVFSLSSFQVNPEPINGDISSDPRGEWVDGGEELIEGTWYLVAQCISGNRDRCAIGAKKYKKKNNNLSDALEGDAVVVTALTNLFLNVISL